MNPDTFIMNAKALITQQDKKRLGVIAFTAVLFLFLLSKCGGTSNGPNVVDLSAVIEREVHAFLKVDESQPHVRVKKSEILASESIGNSVDEIIEGRLASSIVLLEPLYAQVGTLSDVEVLDNDHAVIKRLTKKGKVIDLSGKYKATLSSFNGREKTWNTQIYFDADLKTNFPGFPIARFPVHVLEGSKEEKAIRNEIDIAAEQLRVVKEKFKQKKSAFLQSLSGIWVSTGPLLNSDGKPYYEPVKKPHWDITKPYVEVFCDKPFGAGMQLDIPILTTKSQKVSGKTYWIHDKNRSEKVTGTITVDDKYESFTFLKDEYTGSVTCPAGRRKITMFPLGRPMFAGGVSDDLMTLNETTYGKTSITLRKIESGK